MLTEARLPQWSRRSEFLELRWYRQKKVIFPERLNVTRTQRDFTDVFEDFFDDTADGPLIEFSERTIQSDVFGYFTVTAPWSQNKPLSVSVNLSFADTIRTAVNAKTRELITYPGTDLEEEFNWQKGFITINAEDGSFLDIEPIAGQPDAFLVTTGNGESLGAVSVEVKR